jgi:hypothetical protein
LVNVRSNRYFLPPLEHWHPVSTGVGYDAETANAGAATPTATSGTLHAAPRATERRETCGADMLELQRGVGGGDVGTRHHWVKEKLTAGRRSSWQNETNWTNLVQFGPDAHAD